MSPMSIDWAPWVWKFKSPDDTWEISLRETLRNKIKINEETQWQTPTQWIMFKLSKSRRPEETWGDLRRPEETWGDLRRPVWNALRIFFQPDAGLDRCLGRVVRIWPWVRFAMCAMRGFAKREHDSDWFKQIQTCHPDSTRWPFRTLAVEMPRVFKFSDFSDLSSVVVR